MAHVIVKHAHEICTFSCCLHILPAVFCSSSGPDQSCIHCEGPRSGCQKGNDYSYRYCQASPANRQASPGRRSSEASTHGRTSYRAPSAGYRQNGSSRCEYYAAESASQH